jgi:acyl carrier protein
MIETHDKGPTATEIQSWLVAKIAALLGVSPEEIDVQEDLDFYGLESVEAITLSGELSEWVGRDLSPTIVREYPTIIDIARYLTEGE